MAHTSAEKRELVGDKIRWVLLPIAEALALARSSFPIMLMQRRKPNNPNLNRLASDSSEHPCESTLPPEIPSTVVARSVDTLDQLPEVRRRGHASLAQSRDLAPLLATVQERTLCVLRHSGDHMFRWPRHLGRNYQGPAWTIGG